MLKYNLHRQTQVLKFQSFKVSMVTQGPGFKVSEFQGFNVSPASGIRLSLPLAKRNRPRKRAIETL
jgi:hypothetical protein